MTRYVVFLLLLTGCGLPRSEMRFVEDLTRTVVDSSRLLPGDELPPAMASYGPNLTGITLYKPGGRDCYPSFWIRDYAMSLESGMIPAGEQLELILFTAARQSDSTWITTRGSYVPRGSIPDHIRVNDGLPVYFPGTYSYDDQGDWLWQLPPLDDQFFFIHMVWYYIEQTVDSDILDRVVQGKTLLRRLTDAFESVQVDGQTQLVVISKGLLTTDFGFRDVVSMTGHVAFGSLLRYRAALEMSSLFTQKGNKAIADSYTAIASTIKKHLLPVFADSRGLLKASTGQSAQPDVWATAFAIAIGAIDKKDAARASRTLVRAYKGGELAYEGQIRHILTADDFSDSSAWEVAQAPLNRYQNGAYWGTATAWVIHALRLTNRPAALDLAKEYIAHLRAEDFRQGPAWGGPWECIHPDGNYRQNPVYMTSVTVFYAGIKDLL